MAKARIQNAPKELKENVEIKSPTLEKGEMAKTSVIVTEEKENFVNTPTIDDVKEIASENKGGGVVPENVALLNAKNEFTEENEFNEDVIFDKDIATYGAICLKSEDTTYQLKAVGESLWIYNNDHAEELCLNIGSETISVGKDVVPMSSNDLGTSSSPWKDLFISGDVKDGSGNAKYYTKAQIDEKLQDFVEYKTLTIDVKGPEGDTTVLSGAVIQVFDKLGDKLDEKTYQGVALTFRLPKDETFSIEASKSLSVGGVTYFAPTPSIKSGALTDNVTSIVRYSNTSSMSTIQHVKAFLALDTVSIDDKKLALVATETNPFSVNMTITDPANSTSYEMPIRILEVGTYKKKVNGEEVSFVGALCQMCYCLPDNLQFDEREQAQCGDGETFSSDLRYFSATTSGVGDKAFTLLNVGTDYNVGDSVDAYESSHSVFVFKNGLRNNSNQLSADADVVRYGSNIYHYSNIHKWLNGGDEWFEPSYVGDICSYSSRKGFLTWISQNDLSTIEDNVAYGVYERSGYELPNNEVFARFVLPSVTNLAGSGNANEGNVSEYWKWKNGNKISNGENASRTMQKITAKTSNQYIWFRSPLRSFSRFSWNLNTSGYVFNDAVCRYDAVSPLFTI